MLVALIAETGIRMMDVSTLVPELRCPVERRFKATFHPNRIPSYDPIPVRRFVKMDDHTYVEKD